MHSGISATVTTNSRATKILLFKRASKSRRLLYHCLVGTKLESQPNYINPSTAKVVVTRSCITINVFASLLSIRPCQRAMSLLRGHLKLMRDLVRMIRLTSIHIQTGSFAYRSLARIYVGLHCLFPESEYENIYPSCDAKNLRVSLSDMDILHRLYFRGLFISFIFQHRYSISHSVCLCFLSSLHRAVTIQPRASIFGVIRGRLGALNWKAKFFFSSR
ncbi:hypothetical protein BDV41DRAFT_312752 [Aspergillus transmontanensis]|uniref:Uncharacterized protein n=1 Tax=Aspergillus transmontanensis TaxID=1034304 RepID=A0A5N6VUJ6_9EURO|nr:hypothetical protein BDV41DRAFT_312752 [Aspergillus transmontanensis]